MNYIFAIYFYSIIGGNSMRLNYNINVIEKAAERYIPEKIVPAAFIGLIDATCIAGRLFREYKTARSNNWLKIHGYPMRRKS